MWYVCSAACQDDRIGNEPRGAQSESVPSTSRNLEASMTTTTSKILVIQTKLLDWDVRSSASLTLHPLTGLHMYMFTQFAAQVPTENVQKKSYY